MLSEQTTTDSARTQQSTVYSMCSTLHYNELSAATCLTTVKKKNFSYVFLQSEFKEGTYWSLKHVMVGNARDMCKNLINQINGVEDYYKILKQKRKVKEIWGE